MAKKSRQARQREKSDATPTVAAQVSSSPIAQRTVDFVQEYAYVYKELRNVFIIAIVMFVVLFGLSYVI